MMLKKLFRITLLSAAVSLALTGCGEDEQEMTQEEVQYISHVDQARFFQRQGELKASTLEARSAIEMNPSKADPYFIIVDNLVTAGDAMNAARQVQEIEERMEDGETPDIIHNRIQLVLARTHMMRNQTEEALAALEEMKSPDHSQEVKAAVLRGDIHLNARQPDKAKAAYNDALELDSNSLMALLGLSRIAYGNGNIEEAQSLITKAEGIDKTDPELWLWKGQFAQLQEQWEKAEEAYIRALEDIGQYDVMTYRKYATMSSLITVLREQNKQAEAFVYEEILAKSSPGTIKSNFASAQEAYRSGDLQEATRYLTEVLKQAPQHAQSALMLGMIRFQQGRVEEAERLLTPVAANLEDSASASKLLAATQLRLQRPEEARKLLENLDESQSDPGVLALIGIATLASGDIEAGKEYIEKSLELNPDNSQLRLRYATYLIQTGNTEEAIDQASTVMDKEPNNDDARLLIIQAHVSAGNRDAAMESAAAWIKEQPENIAALITHGDLSVAAGDTEQARQYYEQALELSDTDPRANYALGILAVRQDNPDKAREQFRAAVRKAPDNRRALQGLARVSSQDELSAFLEGLSKDNPDAVGPRLVLLELALLQGNKSKADELVAGLLEPVSENELSPNTSAVAGVYTNAAGSLVRQDKAKQALEVMQRAQVLFPDNENVALQTAELYFRTDRTNEAQNLLKDVRREHPESARPYLLEAQYNAQADQFDKAAEQYELALNKDSSPDIYLRYVDALQKHGQQQKAIEVLKQAIANYPNNGRLALNLAMAYQNVGEQKQAADAYEQVLKNSPDNAIALNNLAWIYHETGETKAKELAAKAYELAPENPAIADTYGWILFSEGSHQESVPVLEKAYNLSPDTQEIALHLVEAYKATGQDPKAKAILEKKQEN